MTIFVCCFQSYFSLNSFQLENKIYTRSSNAIFSIRHTFIIQILYSIIKQILSIEIWFQYDEQSLLTFCICRSCSGIIFFSEVSTWLNLNCKKWQEMSIHVTENFPEFSILFFIFSIYKMATVCVWAGGLRRRWSGLSSCRRWRCWCRGRPSPCRPTPARIWPPWQR